jgi:hypothetical protein
MDFMSVNVSSLSRRNCMYRRIPVVAAALLSLCCIFSTPARADDDTNMPAGEHNKIGVGFHSTSAPVGVRWWLGSEKVGVDLGVGYHSDDAASSGFPGEKLKGWAVNVGVPIIVQSWNRVHVIFRPGVEFASQEVEDFTTPAVFDTQKEKTFDISGELEGEAFILQNFSVSASTGIAFESFDPGFGADKEKSFTTIGNNFTEVGFHLYMFH